MPKAEIVSAVDQLREVLDRDHPELDGFTDRRDEVLGRYGAMFSPENLDALTADDFRSFLQFKNNRHWKGLERLGPSIVEDMDQLRSALRLLLDESVSISERIDRLSSGPEAVPKLRRATLTPILLVVYPDRYAVWNNVSEAKLNALKLWPDFPRGTSEGEKYRRINEIQLDLANRVGTDLWTLDALWWLLEVEDESAPSYWKIAPGRDAERWEMCRDGGFIAVGWDRTGDLSGLTRREFEERRDELVADEVYSTKRRLNQVWRFRNIEPGARILANQGFDRVVGVGTVTGEYYYEEDAPDFRHRLPVEWDDMEPFHAEMNWRPTVVRLNKSKFEEVLRPQPKRTFTEATIEILRELQQDPTQDFVKRYKEELDERVIVPFQSLMRDVVRRLPEKMLGGLEVEKNIYSRFNKNDFGRGGAWTYYWGALYPEGESRVEAVQLFCSMDAGWFDCGFYLGEHSAEARERFAELAAENRDLLLEHVQADALMCGVSVVPSGDDEPSDCPTFGEWLDSPIEPNPHVGAAVPMAEWVALDAKAQVDHVVATFERVYPLYILATSARPRSQLEAWFGEDGGGSQPEYSRATLLEETSLDSETVDRWLRALDRKKQAVLYGPPGTGKTYVAERLARHIVGGTSGQWEVVQFHPAYSYEDFIQGIRPAAMDGRLTYELQPGRFLEFCENARAVAPDPCVLIIDEINRANLSQVFGELMYLLEYRGESTALAAGGTFSIPRNVRILGTMNTADRSIALVDHALRRRFAFLDLWPDMQVLETYHEVRETGFDCTGLAEALLLVNEAIDDRDYQLGISFFLLEDLEDQIEDIWRMEIEPYLQEYFFDDPAKVKPLSWDALSSRIVE